MRSKTIRLLLASFVATLLTALAPTAAWGSTMAALWHMDETSGTTMVDGSGNGNNGTLENVAFVTPGFDGTGAAYSFDGTSSRVLVPNSPGLNPGPLDISVAMHVKFSLVPSSTVGDYDLIRKGGAQIYKIEIFRSGRAHCRFTGTTGTKGITFGPNLADGNWHTIICTKTSSSIQITVDGVSESSAVSIGSISNTVALALGGKANGHGDWYNGAMDEVSIAIG